MTTPIPKPTGLPLLGNVFDIDPGNTWDSLRKLSDKYGEIFQVTVLGQTIVFVAGAQLAGELCDQKRFRKYVGGPIVEIRYAVHDALFTAYDDEPSWGVAHRIIAPKLSAKSVEEQFVGVRDVTGELIAKWKHQQQQSSSSDTVVEILRELNRLNLEVTTLTLFGQRLNNLSGPEHPMLAAMEDATSEAMKRPTRPGIVNWLLHSGKFKSATNTMREWAGDMVRARKEQLSSSSSSPPVSSTATEGGAEENQKDPLLIDVLLQSTDPQTGTCLSESQVIDEIVSMPIGSSTAPCLLSTAVYYLVRNPDVVVKAREELAAVLGSGQGAELQQEHLSQLKYTEAILRESLRLSCAAPGFNVEPVPRAGKDKTPVLLGGGKYQVAHDQAMIVVLAGVNRDKEVFGADAQAFRPERMMGERYDELPEAVKKGFGNGKRECIGKHWAWQFGMVVLARLIGEVDFEEEGVGEEYELRQDGWFNLRPVGFEVNVKVREG